MLGDEDEVRQRMAGVAVVEEKEIERVVRSKVLRVRSQDAIEKPSRLGRIAFALTIQCAIARLT